MNELGALSPNSQDGKLDQLLRGYTGINVSHPVFSRNKITDQLKT